MCETPRQAGTVTVEVSVGELIDKLTILQIKSERVGDSGKLRNIRNELALLVAARDRAVKPSPGLDVLTDQLKQVNEQLWDIEDSIRRCEARRDFGPRFVDLARSVYHNNDRRAALKREINELLGSPIVEEKAYEPYD